MTELDERSELLRPVARNSATNRENSQALLPKQRRGKVLQVFERVETDLVPTGAFTHAIVQRNIQAQFGICECRHEDRHTLLICRLQNPALLFRAPRQERPDLMIQLV